MLLKIIVLLGILGQILNGAPLEDESTNFGKFFDQRIIGGSAAPEGGAPYMAALVAGYQFQAFICGGSIISSRHILTAAHCITVVILWNGQLMDTFHAIVGTNIWHKGTIIEFESYKLHSCYDGFLLKNDVAVLSTNYEIQFNDRVAPIGLNFDFVGAGVESFVTGWGTEHLWGNTPNKLQILQVNTMNSHVCFVESQKAAAEWGGWAPPVHPEWEICTFHSPGHGMCHGDSGSALVAGSTGLQIGIVSWGIPCAIGGPDVFVRISAVKQFIQDALATL